MYTSIRNALALALLLAAVTPEGVAQNIQHLPWTRIAGVERIKDSSFRSISPPSGSLVIGSDTANASSPMFPIQLPSDFKFKFMDKTFGPGDMVWVSITGAVKLRHAADGPPTALLGSYDLQEDSDTTRNQLILPFWGNFESPGTNAGGIYVQFDNGGTFNYQLDDVLIIEWKVTEAGSNPQQIFQFQCRLRGNNVIEFIYNNGPPSPTLGQPTSTNQPLGAVVGIKNVGQAAPGNIFYSAYYPGQSDWRNTLMLTNPDEFQYLGPDTLYISALQTYPTGTTQTPEWYSGDHFNNSSPGPSRYFHYKFPSTNNVTGYRIKPVEQDIGPDTGPLGRVSACNIFTRGDTIIVSTRFTNFGDSNAFNIPVTAILTHVNDSGVIIPPTITINGTVAFIAKDSTVAFTFPDSIRTDTLLAGSYRLCVISNYGTDQYQTNDTVCTMIYIRAVHDAKALCIMEPRLVTNGPLTCYVLGDTVRVSGCFCNAGLARIDSVTVGYVIFDTLRNELHRDSAVIHYFEAGDDRFVQFRGWRPDSAGRYFIHLGTGLANDDNHQNDSLFSYPRSTGTTYGSMDSTPTTIGLPRIPFLVKPAIDLGVGDASRHGHSPNVDTVSPGTQLMAATLLNEGARAQHDVSVHVKITAPGGGVLYDTLLVPEIAAGGSRLIYFKPYSATGPGEYRVTAWVHYPGDVRSSNDTATWHFTVRTPAAVPSETMPSENNRLTITPNPASSDVAIRYMAPQMRPAHLHIDDIYGATVRTVKVAAADGSVHIDVTGLPAGMYFVHLEEATGNRIIRKLVVRH